MKHASGRYSSVLCCYLRRSATMRARRAKRKRAHGCCILRRPSTTPGDLSPFTQSDFRGWLACFKIRHIATSTYQASHVFSRTGSPAMYFYCTSESTVGPGVTDTGEPGFSHESKITWAGRQRDKKRKSSGSGAAAWKPAWFGLFPGVSGSSG